MFRINDIDLTVSGGTMEMLLDDGAALADRRENWRKSTITINGGTIYAPHGFAAAAISVDVKNPAGVTGIVQNTPINTEFHGLSDMEVYGKVETKVTLNDLTTGGPGTKDFHNARDKVKLTVREGASLTLGADVAFTKKTTVLTVEPGGELTVDGGATLNIGGTLTNAGSVINKGRVINKGSVNNTGTIVNADGGKYYAAEGAKVNNSSKFPPNVLPYLTVKRVEHVDKGVSITVTANGWPISDYITFLVWLDRQDPPTSANAYGPFVVESKESALNINVNKLKYPDGTKESIEAGLYLLRFESKDGYYAGEMPKSIHLPGTDAAQPGTDAAQESGGGCNAGHGLFGLLLAGLVTRKYRKA
jgi:hypothetical protein